MADPTVAPWQCWDCGKTLVAYVNVSDNQTRPARDGDALLCTECGAPSAMDNGAWVPMTRELLAKLPDRLRRDVVIAMLAREAIL
jgi:hypothetical protein